LAVFPYASILAAGANDGTVTLWNVSNPAAPRKLLRTPLTTGNGNVADSVGFSKDGTILAVGDNDSTVTLWNVSNPAAPRQLGQPLTTGNRNVVDSVAFSPDGATLATGESGSITQIWNLHVNYATSRICHLANGALTPRQWHQDIPQLHYDPPCPGSR
jgi:WD40 repeat protein